MKSPLIFYYDVVCPYAYLASTRIEALGARVGVPVEWRPILLGGVFKAIGGPDMPGALMPASKAKLSLLDLMRYAALYDVPLKIPIGHPRRSVDAMRLCLAVSGAERVKLTHALYRAYFVDGRDISDRAVLAAIAREAGTAEAALAKLDDPAHKDALRAATDVAVADGVFGVPAFVVARDGGERRLFWGQDRMHLVERALS